MAYYGKVLSCLTSASEIDRLFDKRAVLNSGSLSKRTRSQRVYNKITAVPARPICTVHISNVFKFMDNIKFKYFIEKNFKHPNAVEEVVNFTKCLTLGVRKGLRPRTKVFVFTIVCKGTTLCRATPTASPTSKRRFCGYGLRLYALNGKPEVVHVEEFGRHHDELGEEDLGYLLFPPVAEQRLFTVMMEIDALRSFARGLTPAKHIAYTAEEAMLINSSHGYERTNRDRTSQKIMESAFASTAAVDISQVRKFYRRLRRITNPLEDMDGVMNFISYLNSNSEVFYIDHLNVTTYNEEEPLIILILIREICESADKFASEVLGLDATFDVTAYKFALFAVMGRSNGGALPFAYFVSSSKSERAVSLGLSMFQKGMNSILVDKDVRQHGVDFALDTFTSYSPMAFCIDKDDAEYGAISTVFPSCLIILCHYHAMVIWIDEARALRHNLGAEQIVQLMNVLRQLASSSTIEAFSSTLKLVHNISPSFYLYLLKNFLNDRWAFSEINRQHLSPSVIRTCRSNMLVEVSFKTLKYTIFGGVQNRRLDELLYAIAFRLYPYFIVRHNGVSAYKPRFLTSLKESSQATLLYRYDINQTQLISML